MSTAKKKSSKQIPSLIQKIVLISVAQFLVFGAFILIDSGFNASLKMYFIIVLCISIALVSLMHFYNLKLDEEEEPKSVLDETDFAG